MARGLQMETIFKSANVNPFLPARDGLSFAICGLSCNYENEESINALHASAAISNVDYYEIEL